MKTTYYIVAMTDGHEIFGKPQVMTLDEYVAVQENAARATGDNWGYALITTVQTSNPNEGTECSVANCIGSPKRDNLCDYHHKAATKRIAYLMDHVRSKSEITP